MIFFPYYGIRYRAVRGLQSLCREKRAIVLTLDDGPSTRLTPAVTDILAEYDAKATFFLLGRHVAGRESVVDSLQEAGHELGVHTFEHRHAWHTNGHYATRDLENGYSAVSRWVKADGLFRPPHGKLSFATWRAAKKRRAPICWWTLDSGDTWPKLPEPESIVEKLLSKDGGVVLLHDFDRESERERFVLETIRRILEMGRREGFEILTVSELYNR